MTLSTPNATLASITFAVRNADRDAAHYDVDEFASCLWFVTRKEDRNRMYAVEIGINGEMQCDCPAFAKSAVCKHISMVHDEIAIRELESDYLNSEDLFAKL